MITLLLLFQLNTDMLFRQATEGIKAAREYTAQEMDNAGRLRLRTESLVAVGLLDELRMTNDKLNDCRTMQGKARKEP